MCILDSRDQVLRRKTVRLVRVLWRHCGVEESMWEREDTMRATYPFLFRDEGTWFSRLRFKWLVTCMIECALHIEDDTNGTLRRDLCAFLIAVIRFCDVRP